MKIAHFAVAAAALVAKANGQAFYCEENQENQETPAVFSVQAASLNAYTAYGVDCDDLCSGGAPNTGTEDAANVCIDAYMNVFTSGEIGCLANYYNAPASAIYVGTLTFLEDCGATVPDVIYGGDMAEVIVEIPEQCADGCLPGWEGDTFCDYACNNDACNFDGGDCDDSSGSGGDLSEPQLCADGCLEGWEGDTYCDYACNNEACNFDGGDCAADSGSGDGDDEDFSVFPECLHSCPFADLMAFTEYAGAGNWNAACFMYKDGDCTDECQIQDSETWMYMECTCSPDKKMCQKVLQGTLPTHVPGNCGSYMQPRCRAQPECAWHVDSQTCTDGGACAELTGFKQCRKGYQCGWHDGKCRFVGDIFDDPCFAAHSYDLGSGKRDCLDSAECDWKNRYQICLSKNGHNGY